MIRARILRGAASNYAGKLSSLVVWFALTPFILHRLGPAGYGLWVLVGAVASYGYLLDFGIGGAVVKYVAEHAARGDASRANRLLATALRLYLVLGAGALAASLLVAPLFPRLFRIPASEHATAVQLVVLMGATVGITLAFTPVITALQGLQRYDLYNLVNAGGSLLTAAGTVVVLLLGGGVVGMVAVTIPVTLLMRLAALRLLRRVAPELRFGWRGADRRLVREIVRFSASTFAIQLSGRLNTKSDEFVIAAFLPVGVVAPYAVARRLGELAQLVTEQFLKVLMPLASELDARRDRTRLQKLYVAGTRTTLAILAPTVLALAILAGPILDAWVGPPYGRYAEVVVILAASGFVGTSQWAAGAVLQGMGRHHRIALALLLAGIVNVLLSVALVGPLGLRGVALATLATTTASSLGVVLPYTMRVIGIGPGRALRGIWLPGLLPALPAAGAMLGLRELLHPASPGALAAVAGAGVGVYGAVFLGMREAAEERAALRGLLTAVRRRVRLGSPAKPSGRPPASPPRPAPSPDGPPALS